MKITVKVKVVEDNHRVENFGSGRYFVYSPSDDFATIRSLLSRSIGSPENKVILKSIDSHGNRIVEIG